MDGYAEATGAPFEAQGSRAQPQADAWRAIDSAEQDQILPALCRVQRCLYNPRKNKVARIRGESANYEYRYADAASINDMIRDPLCDNDLVVLSRPINTKGVHEQLTKIVHTPSGQFVGCFWPIQPPGKKPQDYAGSSSYARRYSVNCLLNIFPEDDDANQASGRNAEIQDVGAPETDTERLKRVYAEMLRRARLTDKLQDGERLLALWHSEMEVFADWRDDVDKRGAYEKLTGEVAAAVERAYGPALARVWQMVMAARSGRDVKFAQEVFGSKACVAEVVAMKRATMKAWGMFRDHMVFFINRAKEADENLGTAGFEEEIAAGGRAFEPPQRPAEQLSFDPQKVGAQIARAEQESRDELERMVGQVERDEPPQSKPAFLFHVYDETGDIVTEPITNPLEWAQMYGDVWSNASNLTEAARANAAGLDALTDFPDAMAVLRAAQEASGETSAAPGLKKPVFDFLPLEWPANRAGTGIDCVKAVKLIEHELTMLGTDDATSAWLDANNEVLRSDKLPQSTRMRIDRLVMEHLARVRRT